MEEEPADFEREVGAFDLAENIELKENSIKVEEKKSDEPINLYLPA